MKLNATLENNRTELLKNIREALALKCDQTSQYDRDFCTGMILAIVDNYTAKLQELSVAKIKEQLEQKKQEHDKLQVLAVSEKIQDMHYWKSDGINDLIKELTANGHF